MTKKENILLDREVKILLLSVLKQGYFTSEDVKMLKSKVVDSGFKGFEFLPYTAGAN